MRNVSAEIQGFRRILLRSGEIGADERTLGFVPPERIPYLKTAFNEGDPAETLRSELEKSGRCGSAEQDIEKGGGGLMLKPDSPQKRKGHEETQGSRPKGQG